MRFLLRDLPVSLDREGASPAELASEALGIPARRLHDVRLVRKSLDARRGREPRFVYTLGLDLEPRDARRRSRGRARLQRLDHEPGPRAPHIGHTTAGHADVPPGSHPTPPLRPVIVGAGPAGLLAAWRLARAGVAPLVLERGPDVKTRALGWTRFLRGGVFDPESNLLFGEGGAGAFSDGKLTTRIKDPRVATVLDVLVEDGGAPDEIRWLGKPHLGSNALPAILRRLRHALIDRGVTFRFGARVEALRVDDGRVSGVELADGHLRASAVVLAIGHSARDTVRALHAQGVAMTGKPFQMGVRVEHPQELIDAAQYGRWCGHAKLPVAEYSLVSRARGQPDVFSFCMCPGGEILPATERAGVLCVNGASPRSRGGPFANSGLVVTVRPEAFGGTALGGIAFQERFERRAFQLGGNDFGVPAQRVTDFLERRPSATLLPTSYPLAARPANLEEVLPDDVAAAIRRALRELDHTIPGFAGERGMVVGPESRSSAPLRIERDADTLESPSHPGLFPVGEGAGYAGGIVSAAVDGLRAAEAVIARAARAKP